MTFDSTVTLGNVLTIGTLFAGFVAALISWAVWRAQTVARIEAVEKGKVSTVDCVRSHGDTVTKGFCEQQHEKTNSALEKLSEEWAETAVTLQRVVTNQGWVMDSLKALHAGVRVANPHPQPLPPDPREDAEDLTTGL